MQYGKVATFARKTPQFCESATEKPQYKRILTQRPVSRMLTGLGYSTWLKGRTFPGTIKSTHAECRPQLPRPAKIVASITQLQETLVEVFLRVRVKQGIPEELILDFDATDDPAHGDQFGKVFHGFARRKAGRNHVVCQEGGASGKRQQSPMSSPASLKMNCCPAAV